MSIGISWKLFQSVPEIKIVNKSGKQYLVKFNEKQFDKFVKEFMKDFLKKTEPWKNTCFIKKIQTEFLGKFLRRIIEEFSKPHLQHFLEQFFDFFFFLNLYLYN